MKNKSYSELMSFETFRERFEYLKLAGIVGHSTFGHDRYINQEFYTSDAWQSVRHKVIIRDNGCDLGIEGFEIYDSIIAHHINPITMDDIINRNPCIFDLDNLVCTSLDTHNALHFGKGLMKTNSIVERVPGDTTLW